MRLSDLPQQVSVDPPTIPDHLNAVEDHQELSGVTYPEDIQEGQVDEDVSVGMDVVVYTDEQKGRPWTGRIVKLKESGNLLIHWYTRKTVRSKMFSALTNTDGSPSLSEIERGSVMFWMMSENRREDSFTLSSYWLETIRLEYECLDRN